MSNYESKHHLTCNFCEKSKSEVGKLIVSHDAAICNECIELCSNILTNERTAKKYNKNSVTLNPKRIKQFLDEYVIGQDYAKETLSVAVVNHYKRLYHKTLVEVDKSNILMHGPTGSGKTLLAKSVARFLSVPFIIADATTLTEAGYVGDDANVLIERLLYEANGDVELAEQGIIFIDEIDKIARRNDAGSSIARDISGEGVQQSLLKLVEGTTCKVTFGDGHDKTDVEVDTSNILFIAAGAFAGIEQILKRNRTSTSIGFTQQQPKIQTAETAAQDFIDFGLIPEFVGRFPVSVNVDELSRDEFKRILTEPKNNIIEQIAFYFEVDHVKLTFSDDAIEYIVNKVCDEKLGARALKGVIERALLPYMFNIIDLHDSGVTEIQITASSLTGDGDPIFSKSPHSED